MEFRFEIIRLWENPRRSPDGIRQLFQGVSIAMRESVILRQGRVRFGEADESVRQQIEAIRDIGRLDDLIERLVIVSNWDALTV
jgi:hypothetical protein